MPKKNRPPEANLTAEEHYQRALDAVNRGSSRKAITELNQAIKLNPRYTDAYNLRGLARRTEGKLHLAVADFNMAIKHDAVNVMAYYNRGFVHLELGDF